MAAFKTLIFSVFLAFALESSLATEPPAAEKASPAAGTLGRSEVPLPPSEAFLDIGGRGDGWPGMFSRGTYGFMQDVPSLPTGLAVYAEVLGVRSGSYGFPRYPVAPESGKANETPRGYPGQIWDSLILASNNMWYRILGQNEMRERFKMAGMLVYS